MADFTTAMREALLDACALDWSAISPAIFGSLFQSIMDDKARRNLGAHYTSEENILKLIKPLFLDELWAEFEKVKGNKNKLFEFHKKLRTLTFFDPACGCGNFLVISYRELRELELAVLRASDTSGQQTLDVHSLIGVNVDQFYGIEIEEFAAQIAQVALWLMDHQMNLRVSEEFGLYFARIPLKTTPHVVHGNALTLDWNEVLPAQRCSFVLGNPPFLGKSYQSKGQKTDLELVMHGINGAGDLDYVAAWYVKAAQYLHVAAPARAAQMPGPHTLRFLKSPPTSAPPTPQELALPDSQGRCAFVSTNSITQGEQVGVLWSWLLAQGVHIHFAHRTFSWSNEALGNAAVHCVIIGFGLQDRPDKVIFEYDDIRGAPHAVAVANINPYLVDAPNVALSKRRTPICEVTELVNGSKPTDAGNLVLSDEDKNRLIVIEPKAEKWVRPFLGADEFINGTARWCLWLVDCPPSELRQLPEVMRRVQAVKAMRAASSKVATRENAKVPALFAELRQPQSDYLLVPSVSSERRTYVPIGFISAEVIVSNLVYSLPDATLFHFGILSCTMHTAWMRFTCGRLKSDYRYSNTIVYNNFPWPDLAQSSE